MNGRFLLDTNGVIALLNGDKSIANILISASWIGISVITELEFLAFSGLTTGDEELFQKFKSRVDVISLDASNHTLLQKIITVRQSDRLKMPDAIIAATAMNCQATLITQDIAFGKIPDLMVQQF